MQRVMEMRKVRGARDVTRRKPSSRDSVRMRRARNNRLGDRPSAVDSTTERGKGEF